MVALSATSDPLALKTVARQILLDDPEPPADDVLGQARRQALVELADAKGE